MSSSIKPKLTDLWRDRCGVSAIEFAIIGSLLATLMLGAYDLGNAAQQEIQLQDGRKIRWCLRHQLAHQRRRHPERRRECATDRLGADQSWRRGCCRMQLHECFQRRRDEPFRLHNGRLRHMRGRQRTPNQRHGHDGVHLRGYAVCCSNSTTVRHLCYTLSIDRHRNLSGQAGTSSLEFALVAAPFVFMMVAGMDLGRYFITRTHCTHWLTRL